LQGAAGALIGGRHLDLVGFDPISHLIVQFPSKRPFALDP